MQEIIVLFACLNGNGCAASGSAYHYYNKELVQNIKVNGEKIVSPEVTTFLVAAHNKEVSAQINNYTLKLGVDNISISFNGGF
jgi:hypothetical protein